MARPPVPMAARPPQSGAAGGSARRQAERHARRASARRVQRDLLVFAALATLPLLTYLLVGWGAARVEAVAIATSAAVLLLAWNAGAASRDVDRARRWSLGARAEESTAEALAAVDGWRSTVVLHDVRLPGRRENIDHLVLGAGGVTVVETKRWSGRVVVGRHVRVCGERRDDVLVQVRRLRSAVSRHGGGTAVAGFVCVHGARVRPAWFKLRPTIDGVTFGGPDDLVRWLRRRRRSLRRRELRFLAARFAATDGPSRLERPGLSS